ncbi:hypothetical protein CEP54_002125 [Fusarium duplospermum]|uniref:PNPLA domain-containing protein n=1 Tax=Fusarium duplospermum TaxID=1325734 RepID=A0A428QWV2_9HYPO|nr:hypothetical protein CEP54_002125 [Fusarium duplospermum]
MAQVLTTAQPTEGDHGLDTTGLCLLSLDGGGVRGLATLYVLRGIMDRLNHERENRGLPYVKPCDVFYLIGGTSTGGLIAIMLGRLEMDVDECISTYSNLIAEVFSEKKHWLPFNLLVTVQSRFDSKKLKVAVEKVIRDRGLDPSEQLDNGQERGCKVFVCATSKDLYHIKRLRSYKLPGKKDDPVTVIQAALATSAATTFFDPVLIGTCEYADGALGANNPVDEVEAEAADLWCPEDANLQSLVKCFLSVGTGNPGEKPVGDRVDQLASTLTRITTETEKTAIKFLGRWRRAYELKRYFRFNVQQGLQDVGLEEYKKQPVIQRASEMHLDHYEQVSKVKECVGNLAGKQNPASPELQVSLFTALLLHEADGFIREECYGRGQLNIERLSRQLVPMEQCYINLGIIHQLGERPINPPGPQTSEFSLQRRLKVEGPIEGHRIELPALFDPRRTRSGDLKSPRRIFIRGRAGVGKSTLCKKIAHGFLNDMLWRTLFDRILWIPLRNLRARESRDRYDLTELFRDEFFSQHPKRDSLAEVLRNTCDKAGGGNSLFVLDGLDEIWQDLAPDSDLSRFVHYLLNCPNIIVTSRPSAVLPIHVDSFDLELETIGFRPEQVREYVRKVEPTRAEEIQSFLNAHPLIQSLVRIPIQLDALCYAWDDILEDIPDTMSDLYRIIENGLWRKDLGRLRKKVEGRLVNEKQRLYKTQVRTLIGDERRFVESIAFTGLYNDVIVFDNRFRDLVAEHFDPPPGMLDDFLLKISYLRASDTRRGEQNQTYHFLHLTFQEYFAARYFVRKWTENGTMLCLKMSKRRPRMMDARSFLREYKYSARYNIMWRFVTGLLRAECNDQGDHIVGFFNALQEEPVDLLGPTHERLVTHCLNEISLSETTPAIVSLRNALEQHLSKWLVFQCTRPRSWLPFQGPITLASEMEFPLRSLLSSLREEGDEFRRTLLLSMPPERGVAPPVVKAITSWISVDISGHLANTLVNYFMRTLRSTFLEAKCVTYLTHTLVV